MKYFPTQLQGKTWGVYNTETNKCVATGNKAAMMNAAKVLNDDHEREQHERNEVSDGSRGEQEASAEA